MFGIGCIRLNSSWKFFSSCGVRGRVVAHPDMVNMIAITTNTITTCHVGRSINFFRNSLAIRMASNMFMCLLNYLAARLLQCFSDFSDKERTICS